MGLYATTTSFSDILVDTTLDTATTNLLTKKISLAENTVKSRLSKRYDLSAFDSATAIPPQLTNLTEMLTEGFYYKAASRGNEKMLKRGKTCIDWAMEELEMFVSGKVDLLDTAGSIIPEKENNQWDMTSSTLGYHSTFNEDDPKNWRRDSDKLSDIADERD